MSTGVKLMIVCLLAAVLVVLVFIRKVSERMQTIEGWRPVTGRMLKTRGKVVRYRGAAYIMRGALLLGPPRKNPAAARRRLEQAAVRLGLYVTWK